MTAASEIKPMAHAPISERYLLSCIADKPEVFLARASAEGIDAEAFHLPGHRTMLDHLRADYQKDGLLDLTVFIQRRALDGTIDRMGGPGGIHSIWSYANVDDCGRWTQHAEIAREQKAQRTAFLASQSLASALDSDEAAHIAKQAYEAITAATAGPRRSSTGKQAVDEFTDKFRVDHGAGDFPGAQSGIVVLDDLSGGMKPGELWVVGGRPSRGKSVLLLQVASAFIQRNEPVAVFSPEMMKHEVVGRLISCMGRIDYGGITQPRKIGRNDLQKIQTQAKAIAAAPLWIDATANQTIESILAESERIRDSHGGLSLVVVDYLQLIRGGRSRNETREEEVARVSGSLKQLAKALQCPVLTASQLNEQGQTRESKAIEQDADCVLFIVDDGVKVGKLRNGVRNGVLRLQLDGRFQRFTERPV